MIARNRWYSSGNIYRTMINRRPLYVLVTYLLLCWVESTSACIFVPPGLNEGDMYHSAFVSAGSRNATSCSCVGLITGIIGLSVIGWKKLKSSGNPDPNDKNDVINNFIADPDASSILRQALSNFQEDSTRPTTNDSDDEQV